MLSPANNSQNGQQAGLPAISFTYKSALSGRESIKLPDAVKSCFMRRSSSNKEIDKFDLQNIILRSTFTGTVCQLCETRFKAQEMAGVEECEHEFCRRCLHDYLIYKITVMEEVTCPQENCPALLSTTAPCYLDLPQDYKQRYARFQLWKQTISNPNLRLCPNEQCSGVIDTRQSFACKSCRTEFCGQCMLVKHGGACDANFQRNFKDWKRCPACRMFIEKREGCNHMTCICGHQFCFICAADWEESHYQCGSATDFFHGGFYHQYHFAHNLTRCQQIIVGVLMVIFSPIFIALAVAMLLLCVGLAALLGALGGPCAVGVNTFSSDCCGLWCLIFLVVMPIVMVVCSVGAAIKILYEGVLMLINVIGSYFATIGMLFCPPQDVDDVPFLQGLIE